MKTKVVSKIVSTLLAFAMCVTILPTNIFAATSEAKSEQEYTVVYKSTDKAVIKKFFHQHGNDPTPKIGTPDMRPGYVFREWSPKVSEKIIATDANTKNEIIYTAQWDRDENGNKIPDNKEERYTVVYKATDDIVIKKFFRQLDGMPTPKIGTPDMMPGYVFREWKPVVADKVNADDANDKNEIVYMAQWDKDENGNKIPDNQETKYTVVYKATDDIVIKKFFRQLDGMPTPKIGTPDMMPGYVFREWSPVVADKINATDANTKNEIVYMAQWDEDKNGNKIPDKNEEKYVVTYNDGVKDEEIFKDDVHKDLLKGIKTPDFRLDDVNLDTKGNPYRENYVFVGWKDYKDIVEGNATYTAIWAEDKNNNEIADDKEAHYTVTYTDGVKGKNVFKNDVHKNVLVNTNTPKFRGKVDKNGNPIRKHYVFVKWSPAVSETVTKNVKYVAKWAKDSNDNGIDDSKEAKYNVFYSDGAGGKVFQTKEFKGLLPGVKTPEFGKVPERKGYIFVEWTPAVAKTVTKNASYAAIWAEDKNGNGIDDSKEAKYNVFYSDGAGGKVFQTKEFKGVLTGLKTPEFGKIPERKGYVFVEWTPAVAKTVTKNASYAAIWAEDKNGNGIADDKEARYNVFYSDGAGGKVFQTKEFKGLLPGVKTPEFGKVPERKGYVFVEWTPAVAKTVTKNASYAAIWAEDKNGNGVADSKEVNVFYSDGAGGKVFQTKEFKGLAIGSKTPEFGKVPERKGYVFVEWSPEVSKTVTKNASYAAIWAEDKNGNGIADDKEGKFKVFYSDGAGGKVFQTKEFKGLAAGVKTPEFGKVPERKGYVFVEWSPEVSKTVTKTVSYAAIWAVDKDNDGIADK